MGSTPITSKFRSLSEPVKIHYMPQGIWLSKIFSDSQINFSISPEQKKKIKELVDKTKYAFVNKLVSMTIDETPDYYFDYAVFEQWDGRDLTLSAYSDQSRLKELVDKKTPPNFEKLIKNKPKLKIGKRDGISTQLLLAGEIASKIVSLKHSDNPHPTIDWLVKHHMKYAVLTPIYLNRQPVGVLWGFRSKRLSNQRIKPLFAQLNVLSKAIESMLRSGLEGEYSDYKVRRKIEEVRPTDEVLQIKILEEEALRPITEIRFYSHVYEKEFYERNDYSIPSGDGFAISLKEIVPRYLNENRISLLFIPGFFCNRIFMDPIMRLMALKYGFRSFSMDVRGRSPETLSAKFGVPHWHYDDYVINDFSAAIRFIKEKYGDQVIVVGHSMGGMIPRFYSAAYEDIKKYSGNQNLPDPHEYLRGIVAIASPSVIDLRPNQKSLIRNLSKAINFIPQSIRDQMTDYLAMAFPSLNLHEILNGLNKIHEPLRQYILYLKTAIPTLDQFIGYKEITPAQWYFLLENILCNESTLVLKQFFDAQLDGNNFYSYDRKINYTSHLHKLSLPLFSIIGEIDQIVPPHTIVPYDKLATHPLNQMHYVNQGHLGIGIDPATVQKMGHWVDDWIKKILFYKPKAA